MSGGRDSVRSFGKYSDQHEKQLLTAKEELYNAADENIAFLNEQGVAQGRTDIYEPRKKHLPDLLDEKTYEKWSEEAKSHALGKRLQKEESIKENLIDIQNVFDDVTLKDGTKKKCGHVMAVASAGMGKTTLLRRMAQYGKSGELKIFKGKLILFPDFRRLSNEMILPSKALLGDLFPEVENERMNQRYQWILENPDKVVFIIDALDTLPFQFDKEHPRIGVKDAATAEAILHNLLRKDSGWFPGSLLVTSSREHKVIGLHPSIQPDRCILLDGLRKEAINDLIDGFVGEAKGTEIKDHINRECPSIWPLLSIPVCLVFSIIGFVFDGFKPKTMSGIMVKFFQSLIRSSHVHTSDVITVLRKLLPLSFEGISNESVLFTPTDIRRYGIDPKDVTDLGILIPQSHGGAISSKLMQNDRYFLYFNHQIEQECLAAFHILTMELKEFEVFVMRDLYQQKYTVVRRLLCGILLNDEVLEASEDLVEISDVEVKKQILMKHLAEDYSGAVELFIDLNEAKTGAVQLIRSVIKEVRFRRVTLGLSDIQAVSSVMKQCEYLRKVNLRYCHITEEKFDVFAKNLLDSNVKIGEFIIRDKLLEKHLYQIGQLARHCRFESLGIPSCKLDGKRLQAFLDGAANHDTSEKFKLPTLDVSRNDEFQKDGCFLLGKVVKTHEVENLDASKCNLKLTLIKKFTEGLGDAKISYLNLEDETHRPIYTRSLLDLLPHIEKELNLENWRIDEKQRLKIQDKLGRINSPLLKVKLKGGDEPEYLTLSRPHEKDRLESTSPPATRCQKRLASSNEGIVDESTASSQVELEDRVESTSPPATRCQKRLASSTEGIVDKLSTAFSQVELEGPLYDSQADFVKCIKEEIEETLKESSTTSGGIGKHGGEIELNGCKVIFELNAFDDVTSVSFTVALKKDIAPDGLYGITPAVKCSTGGIKFRGLATIQLTTFCKVDDDASIVVLCKKGGMNANWEKLDATTRSENATISFQVPHFCWYKIFTKLFWPTPVKILLNNYLYYEVETSSICALTCKKNDTVIEKCLNILSRKGYRQNAFVGHDNIQLLENEQIRYQLACEHPADSRIHPDDETRYLGSIFKYSDFEIKTFCLRPAPSVDIAQIRYTLLRPNEEPKISVLPLRWGVLRPQRIATIVGDVTAFVENIHVFRSTIAFYNDHFGDDAVYQISGNQKKGRVLIINNDFQTTREGSEVDVRNMEQLWEGLGFETEKQLNLTAQEMQETCRQFAAGCEDISVVVVIIMTHGGKRPDGKEYFLGEDDEQFLLEDLLALFSANTSPHICGIPKVFLFQACRGLSQDHHQEHADARGIHEHHGIYYAQRADMLITYPTQPGYRAIRNTLHGSWLINAVTRVFMEHAHNTHLLDLLTRVNDAVAREITPDRRIQISVQESSLRKKLYLFPGWPDPPV